MLGELYFYNGITDENYTEEGFFHPVQRADAKFVIGVLKEEDTEATTIGLQICIGDVNQEGDWFFFQRGINAFTDNGNGSIINNSLEGVTGIRIVPGDDDTAFSLSVLEYFPPEKIKSLSPSEYLVD